MARRILSSPAFGRRTVNILALIVIAYLAIGSVKLIINNYQTNQSSVRLQQELGDLEQRNAELKNLLAYYQTDSFKEKEARARLNYQKPGERVVVVAIPPDEDVTSITQPSIETQAATPPSNPQQWWDYFFGKKA